MHMKKPRSKRWFPFPSILLDHLKEAYIGAKAQCKSEGLKANRLPVLFDASASDIGYRIKPKELEKYCKKHLKDLVPNHVYIVPGNEKGTFELNFIRYRGDFFRSNFIQHTSYYAGIERGDLDYLLGREGWDTLSEHYVGYFNTAVQFNIHEILNRWQLRLFGESRPIAKTFKRYSGNETIVEGTESLKPKDIHIQLTLPIAGTEVETHVYAAHGTRVVISEL